MQQIKYYFTITVSSLRFDRYKTATAVAAVQSPCIGYMQRNLS